MTGFIVLTKVGRIDDDKKPAYAAEPSVRMLNVNLIREVYVTDFNETAVSLVGQGNFAGATWHVDETFEDVLNALRARTI